MPYPTFIHQQLAKTMKSRSLRWRSIAMKTAIFVSAIIALRQAFIVNTIPSSLVLHLKSSAAGLYPKVPDDIEIPPGAISVMIVGDSISQGWEGDWTWRYRLWEWFKSQDVVVDFVGPFMGTYPQTVPSTTGEVTIPEPTGLPPTGGVISTAGYAVDVDPEFALNPRHFTAVGRALWQDVGYISPMVERYNPEYLLVLLGFNDIFWGTTGDGSGVLANMEEFVTLVRAAKPNIKFAIGNVPHRAPKSDDLTVRIDAYNNLLAAAIPNWSTEISPIELVHIQENYSCEEDGCPAGHDGLHPNTLGDFQIAHAFSRALIKGYKLGNTELAVPDLWNLPVRAISIPKNLRAVVDAHGVNITWDLVYGARGYDVQSKVLGQQAWDLWPNQKGNHFYTAWPEENVIEMEFMVRMNNGNNEKEGEWSSIIGTCRPWSSLTSEERWAWQSWYRRLSACSWS